MKKSFLLAFALFLSAPAMAEDSPKPAETITLTAQEVSAMREYLGKLPFNEVASIMQFLAQKESDARAKAAAEKKPK